MAGYYGGTSPSQMPWSPPPAVRKPRPVKRDRPAREKKRAEPSRAPGRSPNNPSDRSWTNFPRLSRNRPAQRPAPAPAQPKPPPPVKIGPDLLKLFNEHRAAARPTVNEALLRPRLQAAPSDEENQKAAAATAAGVATPQGQPGFAPASPAPVVPPPPPAPPALSDGLRKLLSDRNWKLPEKGKGPVDMPKSSFEKGGTETLDQHDYRLSLDEWDRIEKTYSTEAAIAAGYIPPAAELATKETDKNTPLLHMQDKESAALTWDAYEKLSGDQKAAIDFNTLLTDAREKDLGKAITLAAPARTQYDESVIKLFGEGHGSTVTAVNTVDLLSQLDMKVVGQDLDEYLSLERAIDTKELGDFEFTKGDVKTLESLATGGAPGTPPAPAPTPEQAFAEVRSPENLAVVDTVDIQQAQKLIKTKLQNPKATAYDFNSLMYGPSKDQSLPPMGFGDETTKWTHPEEKQQNDFFQQSLSILASQDPTKEWGVPAGQDPMGFVMGDLSAATDNDPKIRQQFLDYLQSRVDIVGQYGAPADVALATRLSKRAGLGG